jgi:hypothetical protein
MEILPHFDSIVKIALNGNKDRFFADNYKVYLTLISAIPLHDINIAHFLIKPAS